MKAIQVLLYRIVPSLITIAIFSLIFYGGKAGVNKLGGLLLGDESIFCHSGRSLVLYDLDAIAVTPDGKTIITGGQQINFWDAKTGDKIDEISTFKDKLTELVNSSFNVTDLIVSSDQQLLISAVSWQDLRRNSYAIQIWELPTRQYLKTLTGHSDRIRFLALSPDNQTLLSQDNSGVIHLWDLATSEIKTTIQNEQYKRFPVIFSPDGTIFATIQGNQVKFWDINSGNSVAEVKADVTHTPLAISADNKMLLIQNAGSIKRLREIETGKEILTIEGSLVESSFAITPDHRQILIQTASGIKLYDFLKGKKIKVFDDVKYSNRLDVTPNGKSFLTIDGRGQFTLRNLQTGETTVKFEAKSGMGYHAFIPQARVLVNADRAGNDLTLWNLDNGKRIRRFCNS